MSKQYIRTVHAPQPAGPYSQAIKVGPLVFVSGQSPTDPITGKMGLDIETQTRQALMNIRAILEASGVSMSDIVKVSVFLKNGSDFQEMNEVYKTFFQNNPPTRTTVEAKFVASGMLVAIDAMAYRE